MLKVPAIFVGIFDFGGLVFVCGFVLEGAVAGLIGGRMPSNFCLETKVTMPSLKRDHLYQKTTQPS
jgi:hypothetical protein